MYLSSHKECGSFAAWRKWVGSTRLRAIPDVFVWSRLHFRFSSPQRENLFGLGELILVRAGCVHHLQYNVRLGLNGIRLKVIHRELRVGQVESRSASSR